MTHRHQSLGRANTTLAKRARPARAFTMVEILVVVVLLALFAAVIVPRMAVFGGRSAEAAAERAAAVLSAAARRDTLTSQRVAVAYDAESNTLRMMTLPPDADTWQPDALSPPAMLGDARLARASADTADLESSWRIEFPLSQLRPAIVLEFTDARGNSPYRVELGSRASRATVAPGRRAGASLDLDGAVDLDAAGKENQAW